MRSYKVVMKKSGLTEPRVELESVGPDMDLTFRRAQLAPQTRFGKACKRPAELKAKSRKNITKDPLTGEVKGAVHIPSVRQDIKDISLGHKKVFKRSMPDKEIDSDDDREFDEDIEMEEVVLEWALECLFDCDTLSIETVK